MKWSHLPVAGGLYDQDPRLLDDWRYIFGERSKHEHEEREAEKAKQRNAATGAGRQRGRKPVHRGY